MSIKNHPAVLLFIVIINLLDLVQVNLDCAELLGIYNLPVVYDSLAGYNGFSNRVDFADYAINGLLSAVSVKGVVGYDMLVYGIDDLFFWIR